ncbi:hypothetical protein [Trichormus sp. NMC-1]|uniref:hypothetical protein n=1 Tax=Trichormus sp. NMC-1 TaxID=1853259 RepID=UPI0008DC012A|nr:hypothetical protein [Trichormus sp. NMC-1]
MVRVIFGLVPNRIFNDAVGLLDLLARFLHLQTEEKRDDDGRKFKKETMIFPRYHQLKIFQKTFFQ